MEQQIEIDVSQNITNFDVQVNNNQPVLNIEASNVYSVGFPLYKLAVANGFVGTELEWMYSLVSPTIVETDPIFSSSASFGISQNNINNWNEAFSWGNHANVGYLTEETDPTVTDYVKSLSAFSDIKVNTDALYEPKFNKNTAFNKDFGTISGTIAEGNDSRIINGQTSYSWGNHADVGYLTASSLSGYLTSSAAANTYQPIGSYLTGITGAQVTSALGYTPYNSATNPAGYITSSALSPYLTSSAASSTYSQIGHVHGFSTLTNIPTTLAGHGITDGALDSAVVHLGNTETITGAKTFSALASATITGALTFSGATSTTQLNVYGASTSTITVSRAGFPSIRSVWDYTSGAMQFGTLGNDGYNFITNNTTRMTIAPSSAAVTIGTGTAAGNLTVNGTVDTPTLGTSYVGSSILILAAPATTQVLTMGVYASTGVSYLQTRRSSDANQTYGLVLNPIGGSVGVGQASAGNTFHVHSNSGGDGAIQFSTSALAGSNGISNGFHIGIGTDGGGYIKHKQASYVAIWTNNAEAFRVTGGGVSSLFGFGTNAPSTAKIVVADSTLAASGSLSAGILDMSQTWNTTGSPTAIKLNVTATAAGANSWLMDLQQGGSSAFSVAGLPANQRVRISSVGGLGGILFGTSTSLNSIVADNTQMIFRNNGGNTAGQVTFTFGNGQGNLNPTAATTTGMIIRPAGSVGFNPTSGTANYISLQIGDIINQTGGANGVTRGLYHAPILTAAADYRFIESTQGSLVMADTYLAGSGSLAGSLINLTQTWNTTGTPAAISLNIIDTLSNANSLLMNLQVGGATKFNINKNGTVYIAAGSSITYGFSGRSRIGSDADSNIVLYNNAQNNFGLLKLGGTTSSFPSIKRNGTGVDIRLADDSAFTTLTAQNVIANGIVRLKNYTVATLPTGVQGDTAYVTDATSPTYLGVAVGGGSVVCPVFYNGTNWITI